MTNSWTDIVNTDLVIVMGGNAAEAHPVGFKWVTEAKRKRGAKLIVVDPRFNRSASVSDYYAPIRPGSDIAFLMGVIRWCIENAQPGDIIVLAGKGHEDYQVLPGGVHIHMDEREIVRECLPLVPKR